MITAVDFGPGPAGRAAMARHNARHWEQRARGYYLSVGLIDVIAAVEHARTEWALAATFALAWLLDGGEG